MVSTRSLRLLGLLGLLAVACGEPPTVALSVDLRTDYLAGIEFQEVVLEVADAERREVQSVEVGSYAAGRRVFDFGGLPPDGRRELRVSLVDASGEELAARVLVVAHSDDLALTAVISRDCRGVSCEDGGIAAESCLGGRCVDPECIEGNEPVCEPQCVLDEDCPGRASCSRATCRAGVCLYESESVCGDGFYCDPDDGCAPLADVCADPVLSQTFELGAGMTVPARAHFVDATGVVAPDGVWMLLRFMEAGEAGWEIGSRWLQRVGCDNSLGELIEVERGSDLSRKEGGLALGPEGLLVVGPGEGGLVGHRFDPTTGTPLGTTAIPLDGLDDSTVLAPIQLAQTAAGFVVAGHRFSRDSPAARRGFTRDLDSRGMPLGAAWEAPGEAAPLSSGAGVANVGADTFDIGPGGLVYRMDDLWIREDGGDPRPLEAFAERMPVGGLAVARVGGQTWVTQGSRVDAGVFGPILIARSTEGQAFDASNPSELDRDYHPVLVPAEGGAAALAFSRVTGTWGTSDYREQMFVRRMSVNDTGTFVREEAKEIPYEGTFDTSNGSAVIVDLVPVGGDRFLVVWHQDWSAGRLFARFVEL